MFVVLARWTGPQQAELTLAANDIDHARSLALEHLSPYTELVITDCYNLSDVPDHPINVSKRIEEMMKEKQEEENKNIIQFPGVKH